MEIVHFGLGIVTGLLVIGIVGIVTVGTLVKELRKNVRDLERSSVEEVNNLHRRLDDELRETRAMVDESSRNLVSLLDSRLDKLQSKFKAQLSKG